MGMVIHPSDKRRSKWSSFRGENAQEDLIEQLQRAIDERPQPLYHLDQWMNTPIGVKRVSDSYYSQTTGWQYRFWTRSYTHTFKESQLSAYELSKGEKLLIIDCMKSALGSG
jgi:hypothetical protein